MFSGILPIVAQIGAPIISKLVGNFISDSTKAEAPKPVPQQGPSTIQRIAKQYDVQHMTVGQFKEMLTSLQTAGQLSGKEFSDTMALLDKINGVKNTSPQTQHNFIGLFQQFANSSSPVSSEHHQAKNVLNMLKGLNALNNAVTPIRA